VIWGYKDTFYASSAHCVYNGEKQTDVNNPGLKETDAYPLLPKMVTAGKNFSARGCAATSVRILDLQPALRAFIMFTDLSDV